MCHLLPISHSLFSSPTPGRAALGLHSPSPRVCTRGWAYADVITKISRIDRLPNFLTHGAPLARFARRSSAIIIAELLRAKRASGAPWVRISGKPMRLKKFGCVLPPARPPAHPRVQTRGEGEGSPKAARPWVGGGGGGGNRLREMGADKCHFASTTHPDTQDSD